MKTAFFLYTILITVGFLSCEKRPADLSADTVLTMGNQALLEGLLNFNEDMVNQEINKLTADLEPVDGDHSKNLDTLIGRIGDENPNFKIELLCYACIETLPPQSEILITLDSSGVQVDRIIDITTPDGGLLKSRGMHH